MVFAGGVAAVWTGVASASPRSDPEVALTPAGISIRAEQAELDRVVVAIAERVGIQVIGARPLTGVVSLNLTDVPVAEALGRLLNRRSFVLAYRTPWTGAVADSPNRLWILSDDTAGPAGAAASGSANPDVEALRAAALGADDAVVREEAFEALARIGGVNAERVLREGLRDEDAGVRETAGELLDLDPWEIP